jgi:hypothetical protein
MNKNLSLEQVREQIRQSIKRDSQVGVWLNFWRDIEMKSIF